MADPVFTAKVEKALASATPSRQDIASFKKVYKLPENTNDNVIANLGGGKVYQHTAERDYVLVNGAEQNKFSSKVRYQDLLFYPAGLINPLNNESNIELINIGQQLQPIPGATSAPYWTDPGAVTLSRTGGTIPNSIPGMIDFLEESDGTPFVRFTSPEGYGDAANGKRRSQLFFDWTTSRVRVAWDLSFRFPDEDDAPYSADPLYNYKMLIFQHKGAGEPMLNMTAEVNPDGTYNVYWLQKYSSQASGDVTTYRRTYNTTPLGNISSVSGITRYFQKTVNKGEWVDMVVEAFLDERDISSAGGGRGYLNVYWNGEQILTYAGPTLTIRDTDGSPASAHSWMVGVYRAEAGVPSTLKELDLNRQFDPAPFNRVVDFRRARLLVLNQ